MIDEIAVEYCKKLNVFVSENKKMAPDERRGMPVVFVVTPELPQDVNTFAF